MLIVGYPICNNRIVIWRIKRVSVWSRIGIKPSEAAISAKNRSQPTLQTLVISTYASRALKPSRWMRSAQSKNSWLKLPSAQQKTAWKKANSLRRLSTIINSSADKTIRQLAAKLRQIIKRVSPWARKTWRWRYWRHMTGFAWANSRLNHTHTNFSSNKCES